MKITDSKLYRRWASLPEDRKKLILIVSGFVLLALVGILFSSNANANGPRDSDDIRVSNDVTFGNTYAEGGSAVAEGGNSGPITITETHPDKLKIKNTPDARAPYSNSTGPCVVGFSAGVGVPGFGGSIGKGFVDEECNLRQTAQTFSSLGVPAMGLWLLCRSATVGKVSNPDDCDAMITQMQIEAELSQPALLAQVTEEDLERLRGKLEAQEARIEQQQSKIQELEERKPVIEHVYESAGSEKADEVAEIKERLRRNLEQIGYKDG